MGAAGAGVLELLPAVPRDELLLVVLRDELMRLHQAEIVEDLIGPR